VVGTAVPGTLELVKGMTGVSINFKEEIVWQLV
jgi:hypothetical protein